jgi:hypothetical protein
MTWTYFKLGIMLTLFKQIETNLAVISYRFFETAYETIEIIKFKVD